MQFIGSCHATSHDASQTLCFLSLLQLQPRCLRTDFFRILFVMLLFSVNVVFTALLHSGGS